MTWQQIGPWLATAAGSILVAVIVDLSRRVARLEGTIQLLTERIGWIQRHAEGGAE